MLYLLLAILTSTLIVVTFKIFPKYKIHTLTAITVNYLIATSIGWITSYQQELTFEIATKSEWLYFAFIVGITLILVFNVFAMSSQRVGVAITAVSSKMSVIIPVLIGYFIYNESINIQKIIGIIIIFPAFYLIFKKKEKVDFKKILLILPILLFIGNGSNDSLLKHVQKLYINNDFELFLAVAFFTSFIIGLIILFINYLAGKFKLNIKSILAGLLLGGLNYSSTLFFMKALPHFESSVFFPIFNISIVVSSALIGRLIFKEKLSTINLIGFLIAICAITLIAIS